MYCKLSKTKYVYKIVLALEGRKHLLLNKIRYAAKIGKYF